MVSDEAMKVWKEARDACLAYTLTPDNQAAAAVIEAALTRARNEGIEAAAKVAEDPAVTLVASAVSHARRLISAAILQLKDKGHE